MNHVVSDASSWVLRWHREILPPGRVLDVACGSGRHTRLLAQHGHTVVAVDLVTSGIDDLRDTPNIAIVEADLENSAWPFAKEEFDGVVVTNYLHRPLFPRLIAALKPGGVFIYETFAEGNGQYGRPSNPDFLLQPGELLKETCGVARVVAYEDTYVDQPKPALVQRICAIKNGGIARQFPAPAN